MTEPSSYLRHLPPVLWAHEPPDAPFSLGGMLRIFEKILTGIPDGVPIVHDPPDPDRGPHPHTAITARIAALPDLFDPWKAPADFLPWLAGWVALEFPTLQGDLLWDEYQRRKVTAEIARSYRLRGLRAGLDRSLQLYSAGTVRPRVAIDDGSRLVALVPDETRPAPVTALVNQGPRLDARDGVEIDGIYRPNCLAPGPGGGVFVGDVGTPFNDAASRHRVWRIGPAGHYDMAGVPPRPQRIAARSLAPTDEVVAVAFAPKRGNRPATLYVLDLSRTLFAVPEPAPTATATKVTLTGDGEPVAPVAMCVDTNGDLLILERGSTSGAPRPAVLVVPPASPVSRRRPLRQVVEPLSMLVRGDGSLLIGDGREQQPTADAQFPGNLVAVDRRDPDRWQEKVLLPADVAANPLVAPTGVAAGTDDGHVYVADIGLKPFTPKNSNSPYLVRVAEPAAVYRVDLPAGEPRVTRVSEPGGLVYPRGLVARAGRLIACDPGYPPALREKDSGVGARPFRFEVVIHFRESELPLDPDERRRVRRRVNGDILSIVAAQKPAHIWQVPRIGS